MKLEDQQTKHPTNPINIERQSIFLANLYELKINKYQNTAHDENAWSFSAFFPNRNSKWQRSFMTFDGYQKPLYV